MAQKVSVRIVSDLSGTVLEEEQAETVTYTVDGVTYEMDLSREEAEGFRKQFEQFISISRRVSGRRRTSSPAKRKDTAWENKQIRAWAADNGFEVPARGRIPNEVLTKYHEAQ